MEYAKSHSTTELSPLDLERIYSMRNDVLHLILLPTEQCNFRCTYCYEDFSIGRMKPEVVLGVKRLIDHRVDELRQLKISWFGGEPLLAINVIEEISEHVLTASHKKGFAYVGDITTNAYLLDGRMLERLVSAGVRDFQISLDGPEEFHNLTRVRANGLGSFQQLWGNLLAARESEARISVLLRIHVTPDNLPSMPDFLTEIRETFLIDPRFSVKLKAVERLGGPNDANMDVLGESIKSRALSQLREIVHSKEETAPKKFSACYAARPNSLMIRANGALGKCTVSLAEPENNLGMLRPDGTLQFDNERLYPWLRGWEEGDISALYCPANGFTLGKTTLMQITPRPDGRL